MKKVTKEVIPAAGLGMRVLSATKALPKEMFTIFDKPSSQYIVEEFGEFDIIDIVMVIGRNKNSISFIGDALFVIVLGMILYIIMKKQLVNKW